MRRFSFISAEDDFNDLLKRYEESMHDTNTKYFDVEELEVIIDYYQQTNKLEESKNAINLALRLHPGSTPIQVREARQYLLHGKPNEALELVNIINKIDAFDIDNRLLHANVLIQLDRLDDATVILNHVLEEETYDEKDSACFEIALLLLSEGKVELGIEYLKLGCSYNPENMDLLYELALCYKLHDLPNESIEVYNRIIDLDSYATEAWFSLGQLYFLKEDYQKAIEAYDFATALDDMDITAWLQKGHAHFQNESYQKAIEAYSRYLELTVFKDIGLNLIAECYEKMADYNTAITHYKQVLKFDKDNADAYAGLGVCMLEQELYADSVVYLRQAIKMTPDDSELYVYLAEAYVNLDSPVEAVNAYIEALRLDNTQADTLVALGNLYLDLQEYDLSLPCLLKAFEIDKETEALTFLLAVNYCKLKQYDLALLYLGDASDKDPNACELFLEICPEFINEVESLRI